MDPAIIVFVRLLLVLFLFVMLVYWMLVQRKMYKLLEKNHPQEYKKMGQPYFWQWNNQGYRAMLYGSVSFPKDRELNQLILRFRFTTWLVIILGILQGVLSV